MKVVTELGKGYLEHDIILMNNKIYGTELTFVQNSENKMQKEKTIHLVNLNEINVYYNSYANILNI